MADAALALDLLTDETDIEDLRQAAIAQVQARLAEMERHERLYDADLPTFAADCLKIAPKEGGEKLLVYSSAQRKVDALLDNQRADLGMVRAMLLKPRQFGGTTYIASRYYHRIGRTRGYRAFVLTHHDDATKHIIGMVRRFQENDPYAPALGPRADGLDVYFPEIDSGFGASTAGAKAAGRSFTFQLFHGSEVAYWPNAEEHAGGALETVGHVPGTEVILESTANGIGGYFYNKCQAAMRGDDEYMLIFIPWFEADEYRIETPGGWRPPNEFLELRDLYGLDMQQVRWAYVTNARLATAEALPPTEICWKFRQEYPGTVKEAFAASREGSFIHSRLVEKARKYKAGDQSAAPLVLGCDIATGGGGDEEGGDFNCFIDRQGRAAGRKLHEHFRDHDTVSVANKLGAHIMRLKPDMVFIDAGGGGAAVYDILVRRGFGEVLTLVNFGSGATDERKYGNKRAEMWGDLRDWLADPGGAEIPDDDRLTGDLTGPQAKEDEARRIFLEAKKKLRKRLGFSPDDGDALALTKAAEVYKRANYNFIGTAIGDPRVAY